MTTFAFTMFFAFAFAFATTVATVAAFVATFAAAAFFTALATLFTPAHAWTVAFICWAAFQFFLVDYHVSFFIFYCGLFHFHGRRRFR